MQSEQTKTIDQRSSSIGRRGLAAVRGLTAGAMAGLLMSGTALAGELFEPASSYDLAIARQDTPAASIALSESFARLNRDELGAHMVPLGMDQFPGRARESRGLDGRVEITLAPGVALALKRSDVSRVPGGGVFWSADVVGGGNGTGSFLVERGQILGQVTFDGRIFKVEPVDGDLHRILEIDPASMRGDIVVPLPADLQREAARARSADMPIAAATRKTRIRYLVAFTSKARAASSDIVQDIKFAIAWTNKAFKNSGAKIRYRLVKTMLAKGYDEDSTSYEGNLSDLRSGSAFNKVRRQRNKTKADLVALIREGGAYCGVGYVVEQPSAATSEWGFQVTSRDCIPSTFAHEAGHNMGLNHDRYVSPAGSNSEYNYGYVNLNASIRTIMAYNNLCSDNGKFCTRVQFFSTPKKKASGKKIGKPAGKPGAADATRHLNQNRKGIAAYR